MTYSIYSATVPPMVKMLKALSKIIDKAVAEAGAKNISEESLIAAKLAPDMFAFPRQIEIATASAAQLSARLAGVEVPDLGPVGANFAELKERIARTIAYLESLPEEKFDGAEDRKIAFQGFFGPEEWIGANYARFDRLPNFYFHVVTAYDILRAGGIDVGKRDYLAGSRD